MSLVNMISSLNKDDKAILKMAIDRKHLSAFMEHIQAFKGAFLKVKLVVVVSTDFFEFDETEGKRVYLKIKTMKAIKDNAKDNTYSLRELKEFTEYTGALYMTEGDMKRIEALGMCCEIVD